MHALTAKLRTQNTNLFLIKVSETNQKTTAPDVRGEAAATKTPAETSSGSIAFAFVVEPFTQSADEPFTLTFYRIPPVALELLGEIHINWGDGTSTSPTLTLSIADMERMAAESDFDAVSAVTHCYEKSGPHTITLVAKNGFAPLKALPCQTRELISPLPTLTRGVTASGELVPSQRLPRLVPPPENGGKAALRQLCPDLFRYNTALTRFDDAFSESSVRELPEGLFTPVKKLVSLNRTFQKSALTAVPGKLFVSASADTLCEETFADCADLARVENPFSEGVLPAYSPGFLKGAAPQHFGWAPFVRRAAMGYRRAKATLEDASFDFVWRARREERPEKILTFYPIDLALEGDILIDWGDGSDAERFDWNAVTAVTHVWKDIAPHTVRVHYTDDGPVRPFRIHDGVQQILTPLPHFHPRNIADAGDFYGWAANARQLTAIPPGFFSRNPDITNLEQAFAGCVSLTRVPDDILDGLGKLSNCDSLFAFCKSLARLPESYAGHERNTALDYFAPAAGATGKEKQKADEKEQSHDLS